MENKNHLVTIALAFLLLLGIFLRLSDINIPASNRGPDEKTYTYQAQNILIQRGFEGTRFLIDDYNKHSSLWVFPNPARIGYDLTLAQVMKLTGIHDERAGAYLSVFASIASLVLLILIGLRFFNPAITAIAMAGLIISPMDLAIARRCWQDGFFALICLLSLYLCAELVRNPKRKILYLPLFLSGLYCLLIKETGVVVLGLGILGLIYEGFKRRSVSDIVLPLTTGVLCTAATIGALLLVCGNLSSIAELYGHYISAMPTNAYVVEYQSGPWYQIPQGFWLLTPFFSVFALLGLTVCVLSDKSSTIGNIRNLTVARGMTVFFLLFCLYIIVIPYCQNLRYLSVTFIPFYLLSGWGLWSVVSFCRERSKGLYLAALILMTIAILGFGLRDYHVFKMNFVEKNVPDLSVGFLQQFFK